MEHERARQGALRASMRLTLNPNPGGRGVYEAVQSTMCVEPTLLSLNGAHRTKCEQPHNGDALAATPPLDLSTQLSVSD